MPIQWCHHLYSEGSFGYLPRHLATDWIPRDLQGAYLSTSGFEVTLSLLPLDVQTCACTPPRRAILLVLPHFFLPIAACPSRPCVRECDRRRGGWKHRRRPGHGHVYCSGGPRAGDGVDCSGLERERYGKRRGREPVVHLMSAVCGRVRGRCHHSSSPPPSSLARTSPWQRAAAAIRIWRPKAQASVNQHISGQRTIIPDSSHLLLRCARSISRRCCCPCQCCPVPMTRRARTPMKVDPLIDG